MMKLMNTDMKSLKTVMAAMAAAVICSCGNDTGSEIFENMVFIDGYESSRLLYVSTEDTYTETVVAAVPRPAEKAVDVRYAVDESLVAKYNSDHGTQAVILPAENWSMSSETVTINEGEVKSGAC